jgi:hypothetical protein
VSDSLLFCLHLRYRSDSDKTTALRLSRTTSPRIRSPWLAAGEVGFLANLGGTVKKYWKIGVHWLAALRDLLALPFDAKAWHILKISP